MAFRRAQANRYDYLLRLGLDLGLGLELGLVLGLELESVRVGFSG